MNFVLIILGLLLFFGGQIGKNYSKTNKLSINPFAAFGGKNTVTITNLHQGDTSPPTDRKTDWFGMFGNLASILGLVLSVVGIGLTLWGPAQ